MSMDGKEHPSSKSEIIEEIHRRISYILSTNEYTLDEKEAFARRFFQMLEEYQG